MEDSATAYNPIITPVYAATDSLTAYLKGNYNGLIAKVSTGITIYYLTLPSIVLQNLTNTELSVPATMSGNLVLNKKGNLPASYTAGAITSNTPSITFNALSNSNLLTIGSGIVAFTIPTTTTLNSTGVTTMMNNLYNIYSTSNISSDTTSASQIASLITGGTGTTALTNLYNGVVSKSVGGSIVTTSTALLTAPTWTVAGGGDCIYVDNTQGIDTNTATCTDNRTYTHIGVGATHTKTYNLLKIAGKWWFNQNLAYPLATGYQGTNTWSTSDLGYYSCPGTNSTTTVDCASVSTLGYLYQWSAATGVASNNNDATTFQ